MNAVYKEFFVQSAAADWKYFQNVFQNPAYKNVVTKYAPYQWGYGAGEYPGGYFAAAIDNNPKLVYSAPIVAGFFPADDAVSKLLPQLYVCRCPRSPPSLNVTAFPHRFNLILLHLAYTFDIH